ncbi:MAG: heavy metal translocating P-type ATPase [Oscillospiraceae bacterium]
MKLELLRVLLSAALLIGVNFLPVTGALRVALFLVPYFLAGYDILWQALRGIARGEVFDENFLMAVATVGALCLGDFSEAVAVMIFYKLGELFEEYAVGKSRRSIAELMGIRPDFADVLRGGELLRVPPEEVEVGEIIVVRPGERIPIDGTVVEGASSLNVSALTGESLPRDCTVGDAAVSGSVSLSGVLHIRTDRPFGESTVSKILRLVTESAEKKSRSESFITRFARVYTPAVCYSALALALAPPLCRTLFMGLAPMWGEWLTRALTFLVISCPCALVISIPLGFFGGLGGASSRGILIKGSGYLEALAKTRTVVFDKTGTLTRGVFEVVAAEPAEGFSREALTELAALAESFSNHPISLSLRAACAEAPDSARLSEVSELAGMGVTALADGVPVAVGNARLMASLGVKYDAAEAVGTVVHVAANGAYVGRILIADVVKPTSARAVAELRRAGVGRVVMLTGDTKSAADAVARELALDEAVSGLLPSDKVAELERLLDLRSAGDCLAFVGDGINDAPVLARADVGIAMGALGSDAAIEAADVVLMDDDPAKIALAVKISRKCLRIVRQNIVFALGVKALCLVLGALGIASMWLAVFADVGVMVLAVLNALRTLRTAKL